MLTSQPPQDEPFNHETVVHDHQRGESSASLLPDEHSYRTDPYNPPYGDGFYDNMGPSNATLYDPERALSFAKDGQESAGTYYQFGTRVQSTHIVGAHE
jgi:hypothetical protein